MPLPLTNLDTRRWTDLAQEAQAMIPRYAPAWTDHNSSDPGITTLQLLAWLVEQDVYRLNRVPASHIRKFLGLIGVRPLPPQPSQLVVSIMPTATTAVDFPEGTEIAATSGETGPLLFTLQQPVHAVPARLVALLVQAASDSSPVDNTRHWREQGGFAALGGDPMPGAALWLGFDRPLPVGERVRLALAFDGGKSGPEERARIIAEEAAQAEACRPPLPPAPACAAAPAAPPAPSQPQTLLHHSVRTVWEYYAGGQWQALDPDSGQVWDDTRGLTLDGMVEVAVPAATDSLDAGTGSPLYFLRVRFLSGDYDSPPLLVDVELNAVALKQWAEVLQPWPIQPGVTPSGTASLPGKARFQVTLDGSGSIASLAFSDDESLPLFDVSFYAPATPTQPGYLLFDLVRIGISDGRPGQTFALPQAPVADVSLELYSLEPAGAPQWQQWTLLPDFDAASGRERAFLLDPTAGLISLADGNRGHIPPAGTPLLARWKATRAERGNMRTGASLALAPSLKNWLRLDLLDFQMQAASQGLQTLLKADPRTVWKDKGANYAAMAQQVSITNARPASGGAAAETLTHAAGRAYELLHATTRAITADDYETLTLETPGTAIARARALPGHHPSFPCLAAPGVVTVIVVPDQHRAMPVPSAGLLGSVRHYLARRRIVGTHVEIVGPTYLTVQVTASVKTRPGASAARVRSEIIAALDAFFNPLTGGPAAVAAAPSRPALLTPPAPSTPLAPGLSVIAPAAALVAGVPASPPPEPGWPFGRDVYRSEVLQVIDTVAGVDHVLSLELSGNGGTAQCGNLCLGPTDLVVSGAHSIEVV